MTRNQRNVYDQQHDISNKAALHTPSTSQDSSEQSCFTATTDCAAHIPQPSHRSSRQTLHHVHTTSSACRLGHESDASEFRRARHTYRCRLILIPSSYVRVCKRAEPLFRMWQLTEPAESDMGMQQPSELKKTTNRLSTKTVLIKTSHVSYNLCQ